MIRWPDDPGVPVSFHVAQLIRASLRLTKRDAGASLAMTKESHAFAFLMGGLAALEQLRLSGVDSLSAMQKELETIKTIVEQHHEVVFEEKP